MKLKRLPADLEEQITTFLKAVRKVSPESIPDKRKRDEIAIAAMHRVFALRLAQYSTSEAHDLNLASGPNIPGRQKMAIYVRMGEKRLLQEAIDLAAEKLDAMSGFAGTPAHTSKRQKTS